MPRRLAQPRRAGQRLRVSCGDAVARGESRGWCRCGRALSSWGLNGRAILASGGATKSAMRGFAAPRLSSTRGHPGFDPATRAEFRAQPKMSKRSSRMQHRVRNSKRARAVRDAPWREARLPCGPPANEGDDAPRSAVSGSPRDGLGLKRQPPSIAQRLSARHRGIYGWRTVLSGTGTFPTASLSKGSVPLIPTDFSAVHLCRRSRMIGSPS